MAFGDDLARALSGIQGQYQAQNPWLQSGQALSGTNVQVQGGDDWQNAIAQALAGLGGGLMRGYGMAQSQQQTEQATGKISDIAQALYEGGEMPQIDGLDPILAPAAKSLVASYQGQKLGQKLENDQLIERTKAMAPIQTEQAIAQATALEPIQTRAAVNQATALLPIEMQKQSQKAALDRQNALISAGINTRTPDKIQTQVAELRKEFEKKPEVQAFVTSDIGYNSLKNALKDPSATSDLELIRGAIQAIEPGMAVREGEATAVERSQAIPDQFKGAITKAMSGQSALSPEVREGIVRIAERRYNEYAKKFNLAKDFYAGQATKFVGRDYAPDVTYLPSAEMVAPQSSPSSVNVPAQGAPQAAAPNPVPTPVPLPEGAVPTGRTSKGKPVYQLPNGQLWSE